MGFKGPHTAASIAKMSEAHKGQAVTPETRSKISAAMAGTMNNAKWGKARKVGDWETDWHFREIGRLIRDARLERDISLEELAAATGIGEATLSRIERAVSRRSRNLGPTVNSIVRIALALGVRPYELMP